MTLRFSSLIAGDFRRLAVAKGSPLWLFLGPLALFLGLDPHFLFSEFRSTQLLMGSVAFFFLLHLFTQARRRQQAQRRLQTAGSSIRQWVAMLFSRVLLGSLQLIFVVLSAWVAFRWPLPAAWPTLLLFWIAFTLAASALGLLYGSLSIPSPLDLFMGGTLALLLGLGFYWYSALFLPWRTLPG